MLDVNISKVLAHQRDGPGGLRSHGLGVKGGLGEEARVISI